MAKNNTFGTKFKLDLGAGMVAVAQVMNIGDIEVSADTYDRTTHDSPDSIKEKGKGLIDPGEMTLELLFDASNANHLELKTRAESVEDEPQDYQIVLPAAIGKTLSFKAHVTGFTSSTPLDGDFKATATFTISGKTTYAATE